MFRKIVFRITATLLFLVASMGLAMPTQVYAQTNVPHTQSVQFAPSKCSKIKDKKAKRECEKQEKKKDKTKKKNDDGPNHDLNDDH